ncbi:MAG TPA: glycoside hydrolase N-terminal domain-containing protein, partial [Vicinamibacterales bacterium]|nr:glycoside hydrolase N-terminal domain-containing protein [Vicinamibacterales bacterium]
MKRWLAAAFVAVGVSAAEDTGVRSRFLIAAAEIKNQDLTPVSPAEDGRLRLWYRRPAANWNEALPIGNGRLGAMVFGGVEQERLQLNEDTIWAGEKRDRLNP